MNSQQTPPGNELEREVAAATGWKPDEVREFLKTLSASVSREDTIIYLPHWGNRKLLKEFVRHQLSPGGNSTITPAEFKSRYLSFLQEKEDKDYHHLGELLKKSYAKWEPKALEKTIEYLMGVKRNSGFQKSAVFPSEEVNTLAEDTILEDPGNAFTAEEFKQAFSIKLGKRIFEIKGRKTVSYEEEFKNNRIPTVESRPSGADEMVDPLAQLELALSFLQQIRQHNDSERVCFLSELIFREIRGSLFSDQPLPKDVHDFRSIIQTKYQSQYPGNDTAFRKMLSETLALLHAEFKRIRTRARKRHALNQPAKQEESQTDIMMQTPGNRSHSDLLLLSRLVAEFLFPKPRGRQ